MLFFFEVAIRLFLPQNITPKLSSQERNPALLKFCSSGKSLHPRKEKCCLRNESSHGKPRKPQMVKHLPAVQETLGSIPGLGISPGEGNGNPIQYSWLDNSKDREVWWTM